MMTKNSIIQEINDSAPCVVKTLLSPKAFYSLPTKNERWLDQEREVKKTTGETKKSTRDELREYEN